MNFKHKRILLTGASGGIGQALTKQISQYDCELLLVARDRQALDRLADNLSTNAAKIKTFKADLSCQDDINRLADYVGEQWGQLDMLVNLAGYQCFAAFEDNQPQQINSQLAVNLAAPILLTHALLAYLLASNKAQIVNIGSTFGSIAFANFAVYSAAKFGLRGFSQALSRELASTNVKVCYIAPRATRTDMNSQKVMDMAKETGMKMDDPEFVAQQIVMAIARDKKTHFIGLPERVFSIVNAICPAIVDRALNKQNLIAKKHLENTRAS